MDTLLTLALRLIEIVAIIALADFAAGVVHWIEDAYFTEETPIIGPLFIRPNIVHHHLPRYFTKFNWWKSSRESLLAGLVLLAAASGFGLLTWQLVLFVAVIINANEVHKWSHRTRAENGRIISFLQDWRILQTPRQHGIHHTDPKNTFYCPITNIVNPVLEKIGFWPRLEAVIEKLTGAKHREDTAVRGQGPGPAWLDVYRPRPVKPVTTATTAAQVVAFPPSHGLSTLRVRAGCPHAGAACTGSCPVRHRGPGALRRAA